MEKTKEEVLNCLIRKKDFFTEFKNQISDLKVNSEIKYEVYEQVEEAKSAQTGAWGYYVLGESLHNRDRRTMMFVSYIATLEVTKNKLRNFPVITDLISKIKELTTIQKLILSLLKYDHPKKEDWLFEAETQSASKNCTRDCVGIQGGLRGVV